MSPDAIVLAMVAIADLAVFANLRQMHAERQAQLVRQERVIASLKLAVHRANSAEEMAVPSQLQQAG